MRTETSHEAREDQREVPHRSLTTEVPSATGPSAAPHHALTDPITSCLAAAEETDWAANEEEPHPTRPRYTCRSGAGNATEVLGSPG